MLEAIADFWKPVKRLAPQVKLKAEELQLGSTIGFGFVPQPTLSGRRFTVTAINTYKFGPDILTSFVLSQEKDAGASMIIAETGGEQYIAVSRRISISDRSKLFDHEDIEAVIAREDAQGINAKEVSSDYKGWIASHYKRELYNVGGQLYKGDHRAGLISGESGLDFSYTLLISDNHEHALEIEKYTDGRVEVYATVYRRMSDVGEVSHPGSKEASRPDVKLVSGGGTPIAAPAKPAPKIEAEKNGDKPEEKIEAKIEKPLEVKPVVTEAKVEKPLEKPVDKPVEKIEAKIEAKPAAPVEAPKAEIKTEAKTEVKEHVASTQVKLPEFNAQDVAKKTDEAEIAMTTALSVKASPVPPVSDAIIKIKADTQPFTTQEIKAVNNDINNFVNESIDCELQVANKIIDEAIRQEMRINDVVRRVIGLPVSQQESVQIPVTLTDQDYALLAIRYGIAANDREAIKRRINEDLADFSGANKQKKAA